MDGREYRTIYPGVDVYSSHYTWIALLIIWFIKGKSSKQFDYYQFEITPMSKTYFPYKWLKPLFNLVINVFESMKQLHAFQSIIIIFVSFLIWMGALAYKIYFNVHFPDWGGAFTHWSFALAFFLIIIFWWRLELNSKVHVLLSAHHVFGTFNYILN